METHPLQLTLCLVPRLFQTLKGKRSSRSTNRHRRAFPRITRSPYASRRDRILQKAQVFGV
jgi:hypothetical protein